MTTQKAKESLQKARDLVTSSASFFLPYKRKLGDELERIGHNPRLTKFGKDEEVATVRKLCSVEFLQAAHRRKQEYLAHVQRAIREADKVVFAAVKKPDQTKLDRFEADLRSLKTELMFAPNQRKAYDKLSAFVQKIDNPYLAGRVRDEFAEISTRVMDASGEGAVKIEGDSGIISRSIKTVLGEMYVHLKSGYESEDVREARDVLECAQSMAADTRIFKSPIVQEAAQEAFGRDYSRYLDDTDTFFSANPQLKPADYIDEEAAAERKESERSAWLRKDIDNPTLKV